MSARVPAGNRPNPPSNVARVGINYAYGTAPCTNVFWVRNGNQATPSQGDFMALVHYVGSQWASRMVSNQQANVAYIGAEGLYYGPTGADLGATASFSGQGGSSNPGHPANIACGISWGIVPHYRGGHPRTYLGGIPAEASLDMTSWTPAYASSVAADANAYIDDIAGFSAGQLSDLHLGTVSFVLRNEWRSPAVFRDYVADAATVDNRIDTQRRRLGRDR